MQYPNCRSHTEAVIEEFKANPEEAVAFLDAVLEDGEPDEIQVAIGYIKAAFGEVNSLRQLVAANDNK